MFQFFQRAYVSIKSIVLSVLPSGIISKETTHAAIVQKESKLDALMYFFWNDDPRWKDPYYFISQLIVELKKLEFQLHRYIVLERIAFACACRDRLEQLEIPHYFQYLVEDAKCGGECFVEHSLYPFVMQALSESATARTDYNELIRRVCRLFVTHNHHNLVFTDSSTAFELDEGQVIELESCFVTRNVLGKEGVSCRSL